MLSSSLIRKHGKNKKRERRCWHNEERGLSVAFYIGGEREGLPPCLSSALSLPSRKGERVKRERMSIASTSTFASTLLSTNGLYQLHVPLYIAYTIQYRLMHTSYTTRYIPLLQSLPKGSSKGETSIYTTHEGV